tara:strand:- start:477 stop:788 length:312 start_codon:yes stop_codon:yes gene_type:complete
MSGEIKRYINKDNYHSIINNMSNSDIQKKEKFEATKLMKMIVIILFFFFLMITYLLLKKFLSNDGRYFIIILYIGFTILFYLNYIKIAFYTSKFIQNNLLFKI